MDFVLHFLTFEKIRLVLKKQPLLEQSIKDFSNLYYSYEYEFKSIISFFYKYFKCCGDIQEIVSNEVTIRDGGQVLDKWIAYIRR